MLQEVALETVVMSQEKMLALISCIERAKCLWDRSDSDYKNVNRQQDAWESIASEMEVPYSLLQQKWSSLKGSYRHYKKIYEGSLVTGSSSAEVCRPKWFAYQSMQFLNGVTEGGSRVDTVSKNEKDNTQATTSSCSIPIPEPVATMEEPDEFISLTAPVSSDNNNQNQPQTSQTSVRQRTASAASKRRWHQANLQYNEEVLATLGSITQASQELRSVAIENRLAPLYHGMRDWSPVRQQAMLVKIQFMIAEENVARFVERHNFDPRN
ncbi:uncharacterized protein LOC128298829 [Anopheles moucheti]|uniref:uncharacterized protein LOC128298829 n=1 Tax=Anopheles moucheti TaxID=186751 RepID=UPI0022F13E3C|nr:uncharacterized protein LOC128298829 [Anopheles moucheti]